ncbi:MAG TPA: tetratricopeptide repeat protein [Chloroflexia bacterium]|nr:tetratricopeptide repeat protein [Chloroflexia bacterium]
MNHSKADCAPNNLPGQPTPFIGRVRELDTVSALLRREDVRLVTLTGPGGTGKTRMSLQLASELLCDFPDGVYFVALAPISDPALVASTVAQALGLLEVKDAALVETIKGRLKDKKMLLLLDNFEQVLEAAPLVSWIMSGAPGVKVLVTSREKLHLRGEHEFAVPMMALPDAQHLPPLHDLTQYEAVRLFIDRAVATQRDFEVNNENAPAVAEICARLDGLPLAIELAAARIKMLTPQSMLARLQSRLKLLTGGERDLPVRQQTLRNTINWSHDLMDGDERILFRRLSVFSGSRSLDAMEAICSGGEGPGLEKDVLDVVESLADKSLLRRVADQGKDPRFYMLETIHEYAWERLVESGEAEAFQQRHAEYFLALAEKAEPGLRGSEQVEWTRHLEADHDNMRAALKWSVEHGRADLALRMGAALLLFWKTRGHLTEGRTWLEMALARGIAASTRERARALMAAGTLAASQGDFTQARSLLENSLVLFRELGDQGSILDALRNLGNELRHQGDYDTSHDVLSEGLVLSRETGDAWYIACFLGDLGIVKQNLEDNASARLMYEESLAIRRELKDKRGIAMMLVNVGEILRSEEEYDAAQPLYEEALDLARELGDKWGVGMVMHNLGHVAYRRGDYRYALDLLTESLGLFHEMGYKRDTTYCLAALAGLAGALRMPERAARLFAATHTLSEGTTTHLDPADRIEYARNLAAAQSQLSIDAWRRAWSVGQLMTIDEAVAYALAGKEEMRAALTSQAPTTAAPVAQAGTSESYPAGLTLREVEVLRLVSKGLTDGQVAEKLTLSPRTVQRHLSSVYSKLGVTTRTAAAHFATEHQLV